MLEEFLKGYIVEKQNMKSLWKEEGSSNTPASPPATAKKGKRGGKCQKCPLKASFTKQKEKHFKACKTEKDPKCQGGFSQRFSHS